MPTESSLPNNRPSPDEAAVTTKEAAAILNLSVWYLRSVKRAGCPWMGRKVFVSEIRRWLREHPAFTAKSVWRKEAA